jgi:ADP-heptose:LPS heptosyltransferase
VDELSDFAATANLIEHLDLVVAVDTAVAHLAGAMGKPAYVMLPFMPDWRWMLHRQDSPWYPTLKLFRQRHMNDWTWVIESIARALGGP